MAIEFNKAQNENIGLSNDLSLSPRTEDFSIVVRFNSSSSFAVDYGHFFFDQGVVIANLVQFLIFTDNKLFLRFRDNGNNECLIQAQGPVVNDGVDHIAIGTRDGTTVYLYLDGSLVTSVVNANLGDIIIESGTAPTIAYATKWYDGVIIEMRVYKGKALSLAEAEIIHYAQGADNIVDNLVARWLMNEKPDGTAVVGANSVIDISGQGNHGSPANSPTYRQASVKLIRPPLSTGIKTL